MKRKLFITGALLLLLLFSFIGCDGSCLVSCLTTSDEQKEFYTEYMSEIKPEITGYKITTETQENGIQLKHYEGEYHLQDTDITLTRKNSESYSITFNDKTIEITHVFLFENNDTYKKIYEVWYAYNNDNKEAVPEKIQDNIKGLIPYDNKLFIYTNGTSDRLFSTHYLWQYPCVVMQYDFLEDKLYYVGYYDNVLNYNTAPYLCLAIDK